MEKTIQLLIYVHAAFGGIALLAGTISMLAKKGATIHKKAGLIFFYAMMLSGIIAMVVAVLPRHENPFLFAVGIFSLYFVLTGKRALNFKRKNHNLKVDIAISIMMLLTGIFMIALPIIITKMIHTVLFVFGCVGIFFSIKDLLLYRNSKRLQKEWLQLHLNKMIGGYVAAFTAFVVVNNFFPGVSGWFIPGIIGGFIAAYWSKKIKKTRSKSSS